jgi:hypothetical protein
VTLVILQSEPDIELIHTLDVEVTDGGDILIIEEVEDAAGFQTSSMLWPADRVEAIAVALLAAAREARQQDLLLVLPPCLSALRRSVQ